MQSTTRIIVVEPVSSNCFPCTTGYWILNSEFRFGTISSHWPARIIEMGISGGSNVYGGYEGILRLGDEILRYKIPMFRDWSTGKFRTPLTSIVSAKKSNQPMSFLFLTLLYVLCDLIRYPFRPSREGACHLSSTYGYLSIFVFRYLSVGDCDLC